MTFAAMVYERPTRTHKWTATTTRVSSNGVILIYFRAKATRFYGLRLAF
jgi:hypothetical protein